MGTDRLVGPNISSVTFIFFLIKLTPVERFAVRFLETTCDYYNIEDMDDAEVRRFSRFLL